MAQLPGRMQKKLFELVQELAAGNYQHLEDRGFLRPGTANGTQATLESYPGRLTLPPASAFEDIRELVEYPSKLDNERSWMLVFDLWYDDQATFYVLEATYTEKANGENTLVVEQIV